MALYRSAPDLNVSDDGGRSLLAYALSNQNYIFTRALVVAECEKGGPSRWRRLFELSLGGGKLFVMKSLEILMSESGTDDEALEWLMHDPIWDDSDLACTDRLETVNLIVQRGTLLNN